MPNQTAQIIDRLYGIFYPIYTKWVEQAPTDLYLWEETHGKTCQAIIEQDIMHTGQTFASADDLGARSEYALLAECVAHLRVHHSKLPKTAILEAEIEKACREIQHPLSDNVIQAHHATPITTPTSWRVAQYIVGKGLHSPDSLDALYDAFIDLAHLFLLHDGNITPQEDAQLKIFRASFKQ